MFYMYLLVILLLVNTSSAKNCAACTDIINRIIENIHITHGKNFGGGNARFEEDKMTKYQVSEFRLHEIIEDLWKTFPHGYYKEILQDIEEYELIEDWWKNFFRKNPTADNDTLKDSMKQLCWPRYCCPIGKYGPDCIDCPFCNPNGGLCDGSGSRARYHTGECTCKTGYTGEGCNECIKESYYLANSDSMVECKACDRSCLGCSGPSPKDCEECYNGFERIDTKCIDINECAKDPQICPDGNYCVNLIGRHKCNLCLDTNCKKCEGPQGEQCKECQPDYSLDVSHKCVTMKDEL